MRKRKLDYSGPAVKKSKVVVSEPGKHDETTKFTWKRVVQLNLSKVGCTPSIAKKKLLKDCGLRYLYDNKAVAPVEYATMGLKVYSHALGFDPPGNAANVHTAGVISLRYAMDMVSRVPQIEPATSMQAAVNPVYLEKIHVTKTFINASNVVADIWLSEVFPRTDIGDITGPEAYINDLADRNFLPIYAAAGYDTTSSDSTMGTNYPTGDLVSYPYFHWSMNREFTQKFKVTAEKHFSVPPGGKVTLDFTFFIDNFISYQKFVDMGSVTPSFMPHYMIACRGELCLGGAVNALDVPTYAPVKLATYTNICTVGGAVNPNMFGSATQVFGVQNGVINPAALHKIYEMQPAVQLVDADQ